MEELKRINEKYLEVNGELEKKLQVIEGCLERGLECPCTNVRCSINYDKLMELEEAYVSFFEGEIEERGFMELFGESIFRIQRQ